MTQLPKVDRRGSVDFFFFSLLLFTVSLFSGCFGLDVEKRERLTGEGAVVRALEQVVSVALERREELRVTAHGRL